MVKDRMIAVFVDQEFGDKFDRLRGICPQSTYARAIFEDFFEHHPDGRL